MALGLADLVAGDLAGEPSNLGRVGWGLAVAVLTLLSACWVTGLALVPSVILLALTVVGSGWIFLRVNRSGAQQTSEEKSVVRVWWALGILGGVLAITIALSGAFRPIRQSFLAPVLETLDVPLLATLDSGRLVLLFGSMVFLTASTNGIVRSVLLIAGTQLARSEQRLRGGRLIGAIERLLIYGLAVAGEPTAAALIVSAKSLLRFPELSRVARQSDEAADTPEATPDLATPAVVAVDYITEYFLLGSLVSWFVALVLVLLILEP